MSSIIYDISGILGVLTLLSAYGLLQMRKITSDGAAYSWANLIGSVLIMISLLKDWNLSAFLLEAAWALVSIYGLWKLRKNQLS